MWSSTVVTREQLSELLNANHSYLLGIAGGIIMPVSWGRFFGVVSLRNARSGRLGGLWGGGGLSIVRSFRGPCSTLFSRRSYFNQNSGSKVAESQNKCGRNLHARALEKYVVLNKEHQLMNIQRVVFLRLWSLFLSSSYATSRGNILWHWSCES